MQHLKPSVQVMSYNLKIASCDTTLENIINCLLSDVPTAFETILCNVSNCDRNKKTSPIPKTTIMYTMNNGKLDGLQQYINQKFINNTTECKYTKNNINFCIGQKSTTFKISNMHLFIEILNWEGKILDCLPYTYNIFLKL